MIQFRIRCGGDTRWQGSGTSEISAIATRTFRRKEKRSATKQSIYRIWRTPNTIGTMHIHVERSGERSYHEQRKVMIVSWIARSSATCVGVLGHFVSVYGQ